MTDSLKRSRACSDERLQDDRQPPFTWEEKEALRFMRDFFSGQALVYLRSTYFALTEIASDHPQWAGAINSSQLWGGQHAIASYSGVQWSSHVRCRVILELLQLISTEEIRSQTGQRAGMVIHLLPAPVRGEGLPKEKRFSSLANLSEIRKTLQAVVGMGLLLDASRLHRQAPSRQDVPQIEEHVVVEEQEPVERPRSGPNGPGAPAAPPPHGPSTELDPPPADLPTEPRKAPETREEFAAAVCGEVRRRAREGKLPGYLYAREALGFDVIPVLARAVHKGVNGGGPPSLEAAARLLASLEAAGDLPTPPAPAGPEKQSPAAFYVWRIRTVLESSGPVPPFDFALSGTCPDGRTWGEALTCEPR